MADHLLKREVEVNAPIEKVFEVITNPAKIPLVMPGLIENTNIPKLPLKKGDKFKYKYQMFGVILTGTWTVDKIEFPSAYEATTDGDIPSKWKYKLISKKGKTLLEFEVKYEIPKSVIAQVKGAAIKSMNEKETDHYMHNLQTVLEM